MPLEAGLSSSRTQRSPTNRPRLNASAKSGWREARPRGVSSAWLRTRLCLR
jgi:hypothetical protein